jgi:hypothetical protein
MNGNVQLEPLNDLILRGGDGNRETPFNVVSIVSELGRDLVRGFALTNCLADGPSSNGGSTVGTLSLGPGNTRVCGTKVDTDDDLAIGDVELLKLHLGVAIQGKSSIMGVRVRGGEISQAASTLLSSFYWNGPRTAQFRISFSLSVQLATLPISK